MNRKRLQVFHTCHPGGRAFFYQTKWADDLSQFKLGIKARQIGITTTESIDNFLRCLAWEESQGDPSPPVVIFVSPSMRQSVRLMEYVQRARRRFEKAYKVNVTFKKEREDLLQFENGSEMWSLPNNPRTIEGLDGSRGIIDEMGNFVGQEDKEIYDSIMASLSAKGGSLVVFGRPRGRRGLFWQLADPYGDYAKNFSIHKMSWELRASRDDRYAKTVQEHRLRMTPLAFKENYMGEFTDEAVAIFPWDLLDRQTDKSLLINGTNEALSSGNPIQLGIDFGKKESFTVITAVEVGNDGIKYRMKVKTRESFEKQIELISDWIKKLRPTVVNLDKTGLGIPLEESLVKLFPGTIRGVQFTSQIKERLVMNCFQLLSSGRLFIPDDQDLKEQLHGIEKQVMESGRVKLTGKRSETDWLDDEAWSLFLAVDGIGEGSWQFLVAETSKGKPMNSYEAFVKDMDEYGNPN